MRILLTCFIITLVTSTSLRAQTSKAIDHFAARYKRAKTEIQKRTVCIELIDAGLLYTGAHIDEIKRVFQGDFEEMGMDGRSNKLAIVHFVRPEPPSYPMASDVWTGWFLSISYLQDGTIMNYSLSNESKDTSMRLLIEREKSEGRTNVDLGVPIPILGRTNAPSILTNTNSLGP